MNKLLKTIHTWLACLAISALVVACAAPALDVAQADAPQPPAASATPPAATAPPPASTATPGPAPTRAEQMLQQLAQVQLPDGNQREQAMRLLGIADIPEVVATNATSRELGDTDKFWVSNLDNDKHFQVQASLKYRGEFVYLYIEDGLDFKPAEAKALVDRFETQMLPAVKKFFGNEWNPGVDGDPRLFILFARGLGSSVLGYFSSVDSFSQLAHKYSNEREMFYINASLTELGNPQLASTLGHEYQHMVHWANDPNEETWVNEGSSVLAEFLSGALPGFDFSFLSNPDLQLNAWSEAGANSDSLPHYGAGFLFLLYFLDRFGEEATRALVASPLNGMASIDEVLRTQDFRDPLTGAVITADDLFTDWVVANRINSSKWGDGRFVYGNYPAFPADAMPAPQAAACPFTTSGGVKQYGTDYVALECSAPATLRFSGGQLVPVTPAQPHSGSFAMWSNRSDSIDTTLTRAFDLRNVKKATLDYWAWWQLELNYDYAYVLASTDGGSSWKFLQTQSTTTDDPTGNNFGTGYQGDSGAGPSAAAGATAKWVREQVDLTPFAGQELLLRFEYITDGAVNRPGLLLDDLRIAELDYFEDFEAGAAGWELNGWVRLENELPQRWLLQVLDGSTRTVQRIAVSAGAATVKINGPVTLAISGLTPFTTEAAQYELKVTVP